MPRFGAHISAAGGIEKAIDRGVAIGAETIQIFGSPPQSLIPPKHSPEAVAKFKSAAKEAGVTPVFLHAPYLINLATAKSDYLQTCINSLTLATKLAEELGAQGVIFHTGSSGERPFEEALHQIIVALKKVVDQTESAEIIIENSAGAGGTVGDRPAEIGAIVTGVGSPRVKTCLDTQHAFASGYDLRTELGLGTMLADWDREIGLHRLVVIHANDSKIPLGGNRDRHENIGEGLIGKAGFKLMKENEVLGRLPWIIEVPGFADQGPDRQNLDILRRL